MIRARGCFRSPFLLEKGSLSKVGEIGSREVIEVVFIPRLAEFL